MRNSDNINELAAAMSKAQGQMKPAVKDSLNPHFKSKFSNLTSVWEAMREPFTKNGLSVWQDITTCDKTVSVTTKVVHSSGQWVEFGPLTIPLGKFDAQGIGSATSYAKRYALCAALGVVSDEDDDGNSAAASMKQEIPPSPPAPPEPKIKEAEIIELNDLLQQTNDDFRKTFLNYLQDQYQSKGLNVIPLKDYKKFKDRAEAAIKMLKEGEK